MANGKGKRRRRRHSEAARMAAADHVRLDNTATGETAGWDAALARAEPTTPEEGQERVRQAGAAGRVTLDGAEPAGDGAGNGSGGDAGDAAGDGAAAVGDGRVTLDAERVRITAVSRVLLDAGQSHRLEHFIDSGQSADEVFRELYDRRANQHEQQDQQSGGLRQPATQRHDQTDVGRMARGISDALVQLTGSESVARVQAYEREQLGESTHRIDGAEFRGMRASELVRCCFSAAGMHVPTRATEQDITAMMFREAMQADRTPAGDMASWDRVRFARSFEPWTVNGQNLDAGAERVMLATGLGGLPGAQGRDQFPNVLRDAMHRVLLAWFSGDSGEDLIWRRFCRIVSASDFRPHYHTFIGGLPDLKERTESGDFETVQLGDGEQSSIAVRRHGEYVRISYETIVNDDLGRVMETTMHLGSASNRTVENRLFNDVLRPNAGSGRGPAGGADALFAGNSVIAGALDSAKVWEMWTALKTQGALIEGADVDDRAYIGFMGDTVLTSTMNRGLWETILMDDRERGASGGPRIYGVGGKIKTLLDSPRVDTNTRSYMLNGSRRPVAVSFLRGRDAPYLQQQDCWDMAGTVFFGALDFECKALTKRGIVMNTGA